MTKRILHIWNTAGVASILAKFMDQYAPTQSWMVTRKKFDKFGTATYGETVDFGPRRFILEMLMRARKYDLIHVHALDKLVPWLKRLYPLKPVVLHYHGSEIRRKWSAREKYWKHANLLLVSTPDLLENAPSRAIWLPNPVDTDLFYPRSSSRKLGHAFHISYNAVKLAKQYAQDHNLTLEIQNRTKKPIPYPELGKVLSSYEYYIDVRRVNVEGKNNLLLAFLSKTALEALACGCKLIRWDGQIVTQLANQHKPIEVVNKLWKLYCETFNW